MNDEIPPTQPTIETLLERMNQMERTLIEHFDNRLSEFRKEVKTDLHKLEKRIEVVSIELNKLQGEIRSLDSRLEGLEKEHA